MLPLLLLAGAATTRPAAPFAPTSSYEKRDLAGWTVYVAADLREKDPELAAKAVELLGVKLFDLERALPQRAVRSLKPVPVWLERDDAGIPGGCYHPSADWLREHGYNPDKAGAVEFGNAKNFLSWSHDQPSMVLHEFAHAYHHRVLGYSNRAIKGAFDNANAHHLYDSVLRSNGHTERAYAMNNEQEYFAESSEAFFGTNDFYPFVRAELEQHDPVMAQTLRDLWAVHK